MIRTFLFFTFLLIGLRSFSQNIITKHWSMTIDAGGNLFDGDMPQPYNSIRPNTFGSSVEYTFTPTLGLGLELYYIPLKAENLKNNSYFTSDLFHLTPYLALNFVNLIYNDSKSKWGIWATVGLGLAHYNSKYYLNEVLTDGVPNGLAITIPVGGLIEYNISNTFAIGIKINYRSHNKDNLEGGTSKLLPPYTYNGVTNDFVSVGTFILRYKFSAKGKNHVRNMSMDAYFPEKTLAIGENLKKNEKLQKEVEELKNELNKLLPEVDSLRNLTADGVDSDGDGVPDSRDKEPNTPKNTVVDFWGRTIKGIKMVSDNNTTSKEVSVKTPKINSNSKILADGKDTDGDGVPDNRDLEPNTPKNTPVDFWGRTIKEVAVQDSIPPIYFDFDKADLNEDALASIKLVAKRMKDNKLLIVEVRGYTDNVGKMDHNLALSLRRANKVKDELVTIYGISAKRIVTNGKGVVLESKADPHLSRRCSFFFDK